MVLAEHFMMNVTTLFPSRCEQTKRGVYCNGVCKLAYPTPLLMSKRLQIALARVLLRIRGTTATRQVKSKKRRRFSFFRSKKRSNEPNYNSSSAQKQQQIYEHASINTDFVQKLESDLEKKFDSPPVPGCGSQCDEDDHMSKFDMSHTSSTVGSYSCWSSSSTDYTGSTHMSYGTNHGNADKDCTPVMTCPDIRLLCARESFSVDGAVGEKLQFQ